MPHNKFQSIVFGLIMSYSMAIGMEIFNTAVKLGVNLTPGGFTNLTGAVFAGAAKEIWYMGAIVFVLSELFGNRAGAAAAAKRCDPQRDNPYLCRLMRQACTVAVMCPTMSLAASLMFNVIPGVRPAAELPEIWLGTLMKNFPMAFFWNMYAAAPFTHLLFGAIFREGTHKEAAIDMVPEGDKI